MHFPFIVQVQPALQPAQFCNVHLMLVLKTFAVGLAPDGAQPSVAFSNVQGSHFRGFDYPAGLTQQCVRADWPGDGVQYAALRRAEVTCDIAALLLSAVDRERADFLIRGDEVFVEVLAGFDIGQCVRTERLGVVSGETGVFKVAGDVHHEHQLVFVPGCLGRGYLVVEEQHLSAIGFAGWPLRFRWR